MPFLIIYRKPASRKNMNSTMVMKPSLPRARKFTAHGYMKMTSTSNSTNTMAVRKYFTEIGVRALPTDSIPHSKEAFYTALVR